MLLPCVIITQSFKGCYSTLFFDRDNTLNYILVLVVVTVLEVVVVIGLKVLVYNTNNKNSVTLFK